MRRLLVVVVILSLGQGAAAAAGPLEVSTARAAALLGQGSGSASSRSGKRPLLWTGAALSGAGVALMLVGKSSCENLGGSIRRCTESPGLKWLGLGVAGLGGSLLVVGAKKSTQILVGPSSVTYRRRF